MSMGNEPEVRGPPEGQPCLEKARGMAGATATPGGDKTPSLPVASVGAGPGCR